MDLKGCEKTADALASLLSKGGFGDIKPQDITLPTLWASFNERIKTTKANSYDAQKAAESMKVKRSSMDRMKERMDAARNR